MHNGEVRFSFLTAFLELVWHWFMKYEMLEWGDGKGLCFKNIHLKAGGISVCGSVLFEQGEINLGGKTLTQHRTSTTAVPTVHCVLQAHTLAYCLIYFTF